MSVDIKIFLGDDEEEDADDDEQIEEMATEEAQDLISSQNPRSNSVTGKYNDNMRQGNLMGAGALSNNAASSNIQPSFEGFGGIVGVSAGAKQKGGANTTQN